MKALARVGLALVVLVVALGLGELIVRASGPAAPRLPGPPHPPLGRPTGDGSALQFELVPGRTSRQAFPAGNGERVVTYAVNADGLRAPSEDWSPRADVARVAVVGDSFVFGTGVSFADTLPACLGVELAARGVDVEVLDLGVPGYAIEQSAHVASGRALAFAPRVVVLVVYANDPLPAGVVAPRLEDGDGMPAWASGSRLVRATFERLGWLESWRVAVHVGWLRELWAPEGLGWARVESSLRDAAHALAARDVPLLIAWFPPLVELQAPPLADEAARLAGLCDELGLAFVDLTPALAERAAHELWVHPADRHPTGEGYRLAARALAPAVVGLLR